MSINFKESTIEDIKEYLKLNCRLLTTIQKDKCLIQLFYYLENKYHIEREECIKLYNNANECIFLTDGKKCDKHIHKDRLCKKHFKFVNK